MSMAHRSPYRPTIASGRLPIGSANCPVAAVSSSFGIGGTNAHVILEEATLPEVARDGRRPRELHLVTVSARGEEAFRRNAAALADHLGGLPDRDIAAATRALHLTRESHPLRAAVVVDRAAPAAALATAEARASRPAATVAFCFSGQGSQRAGTARTLYRGRADGGRFRRHFDTACASLAPHLDDDPWALILGADDETVRRPVTTQCGLFAVGYALARTLTDVGVTPLAVAGHSIGEYAAAVVAGLLNLDEAARLVAVRAGATENLAAAGGMLSVVGDEQHLARWLAGRTDLWLAAQNAPNRVVLAGSAAALRAAAAELSRLRFTCRAVPVSHPFHSGLMAPVADRIAAAAAGIAPRVAARPIASNVTGSWFDTGYRPDEYWAAHALSPVRWRDDVDTLLRWEPDILVEVGPGTVLTALSTKCVAAHGDAAPATLATLADPADDEAGLLAAIGQLWCHGVEVDFAAFHLGDPDTSPAVRRALPTYRFDPTSYWTRPEASLYVDAGPAEPVAADPTTTGAGTGPLVRFVDRPAARTRLYCLPFAGGTPDAFRSWAHAAPDWLDVVAVHPDGADHAAHIEADAGGAAVAFCGLSSGASQVLDLLTGDLAGWAAGRRVEAVCVVGRGPLAAALSGVPLDDYLIAPDELRAEPRWRAEVLPRLHADLARDTDHAARVVARGQRLDCPVQVHHGTADPSFPAASAARWADATTSPIVETRAHEGGHDFMVRHRTDVLASLVSFLERLDPAAGVGGGRLYDVRWVPTGVASAGSGPRRSPDDRSRVSGARPVPWVDLDDPTAADWLAATLTGPAAVAALRCRPAHDGGAGLLRVLRRLARAEARGRLFLVLPTGPYGGLAAGMSRCLPHEEPGLTVLRYYTDDLEPMPALPIDTDETDLLARGGHLLAPRLLPLDQPDLPPGTLGGTGGSYLLTGGTGGIGRALTDWLIHHQSVEPGNVIVTGRVDPGDLRPGIRFIPMDFAGAVGVNAVEVGVGAVGDGVGRAELAELAGRIGPLAGVVHLAGALDDGLLRDLDADRLPAVLAPKLAWPRLVELGRAAGAGWLVAFSSTSALLGAAGQANYAAANGWLDAAANWSPPAGAPVVATVDWGTWGQVGLAAGNERALAAARATGETPLTTGAALRLFGQALGGLLAGTATGRHLAACDIDRDHPTWAGRPLLAHLPPPSSSEGRPPAGERPAGMRPAGRPGAAVPAHDDDPDGVRAFLRTYVHRWDESQLLADLGLDSLDFVRLRGDFARVFGRDVPLADIARPDGRLGELYGLLARRTGGGPT